MGRRRPAARRAALLAAAAACALPAAARAADLSAPAALEVPVGGGRALSAGAPAPALSGFTGPVRVVVSATAGTVTLADSTGLGAVTGHPVADWAAGAAEIAFEAPDQARANAALAGLAYRAPASGETALVTISAALGGAGYDPGSGHRYAVGGDGVTPVSWTAARAAAEASSLDGLTGYLATITSAAERDFLDGLGAEGWIGASDAAQEGRWEWAGGPEAGSAFWDAGSPLGFAGWAGGEPDDGAGVGEDHARVAPGGAWSDADDAGGAVTRYVVEYGGMPGETPLERASASVGVTIVEGPPGVATGRPGAVGAGEATLAATVQATGGAATARLAYGTDPALADASTAVTAPVALAGRGPRQVAARVTGLRPATTYYVRAEAANAAGAAAGPVVAFTTRTPPGPRLRIGLPRCLPAARAALTVTAWLSRPASLSYAIARRAGAPALRACPSPRAGVAGRAPRTAPVVPPRPLGARPAGLSSFRLGVAPAAAGAGVRRPAATAVRLRPGTYRITVRAVDEYGQDWTAARHVRVLRP